MNDDIPEPAHVPANMSCVFRLDYPGWCCWWWRWEASSLKYSFRPQRVRRCAVHLLRTTPVHIQFNQGLQDSSRPILAAFRPSDGGAKLQVSSCISLACKSTFEVILRWDPLSKKYSRIHCKNLATPPASSSSSSSSSGNSRRQVGGWKIIRMTTYVNATKVISIQIRFQLNFDCRIFSLTPTSPTPSSSQLMEFAKIISTSWFFVYFGLRRMTECTLSREQQLERDISSGSRMGGWILKSDFTVCGRNGAYSVWFMHSG